MVSAPSRGLFLAQTVAQHFILKLTTKTNLLSGDESAGIPSIRRLELWDTQELLNHLKFENSGITAISRR